MQINKNWSLVASLVILIFILTACRQFPAECSGEGTFCVGLVTAYEGVENHGLNQVTWEALKGLETQVHLARLDYIESIDSRDWQKNILYFADNRYDVVITVGTSMGDAMRAVAAEYPDTAFIGVDQEFEEYDENIATIGFPEDQAGFLAGMLAAMVSPSGKIGAICEASGIEVVWQYCEGFRAGALYEKDEIEVSIVYHDSGERDQTFNDPEWGKQEMLNLIDNGVDTMSAFGGNTAQGAYLIASEKGVLVVGSEEDLYYRLPDVQPYLVTSIIKDPGMQLFSLILSASRGEAISGPHTGQIGYAPFRIAPFATDQEIKSNMEDALQKIRNGDIEINLPQKSNNSLLSDNKFENIQQFNPV